MSVGICVEEGIRASYSAVASAGASGVGSAGPEDLELTTLSCTGIFGGVVLS